MNIKANVKQLNNYYSGVFCVCVCFFQNSRCCMALKQGVFCLYKSMKSLQGK